MNHVKKDSWLWLGLNALCSDHCLRIILARSKTVLDIFSKNNYDWLSLCSATLVLNSAKTNKLLLSDPPKSENSLDILFI